MKSRLFTPGPTPIPENVMLKMAEPIIHHRHAEFIQLFGEVNQNLKYLFQTKNDVYTLTGSGTGAMETAVVNLLSPQDKVITVEGGKFGERWTEICKTYNVSADVIKVEWGKSVSPEEIKKRLTKETKAVFVTHSETSTGVFTDVKEISKVVHQNSDAVLVVDGISSIGALEIKTDEWNLDVAITGSQKGLMVPPGLAFISVSEKAWKLVENSRLPKYYFSLNKAKKSLSTGDTPWTPAITIIIGLNTALKMIREWGIENIWDHHQKLADATRAGVKALSLKLLAENPSNALTATFSPEGIDADKIVKILKSKCNITVAGGQDHLKGKIFRISHLGYYDELDVIAMISGLEMALKELGYKFEAGAGVSSAQKVLL